MPITHDDMLAGQAVYSPRMLAIYDLLVLGLSCRCIWRCPSSRMLAQYNNCVSGNHLEVGVGTGYFLDRCRFPVERPRLVLADLNTECLAATAHRVSRYQPQRVQWNVFEPMSTARTLDAGANPPNADELAGGLAPFDSVGINFVFHCLPGNLPAKGVVFDQLKTVMNPGAVVFGSTLLTHGVRRNFLARRLMTFYNGKKIFTNNEDSLDDLRQILSARFARYTVEVVGCAALFEAYV
jgi:hypothetical protein